MADRSDREGKWSVEDRVRLLEEDVDRNDARDVERDAEMARLKGILMGFLVMLATAAVMLAANLAAAGK